MSRAKHIGLIILFNLPLLPWTLLGVLWATTMPPTEGRQLARIVTSLIDTPVIQVPFHPPGNFESWQRISLPSH